MKYLLIILVLIGNQLKAQEFFEDTDNQFINISGDVKFSDLDGDGIIDIVLSGWSDRSEGERETVVYINQGNRIFLESIENDLEKLGNTSLSIGDINGDGDNDLILTGNQGFFVSFTYLYENKDGVLNVVSDSNIEHLNLGTSNLIDIDKDGDLDLFLTGINRTFQKVSQLYINNGGGLFEQDTTNVFEGVDESAIDFADIDNDGDLDFALTGWDNSNQPLTRIYVNDGSGSFIDKTSSNVIQIKDGDIKFDDLDNDGDQDFIIIGSSTGTNRFNTKVYINDGNGDFTEESTIEFSQFSNGSVAFIDVDNDNDKDVVFSGSGLNGITSILYYNLGDLNFILSPNQPFENLNGSMGVGDIDSDTDFDIIFSGNNSTTGEQTRLYFNSHITNVDNIEGEPQFSLSPNPVSESLIVVTHNLYKIPEIKISNLEGNTIKNYNVIHNLQSSQIEFENLNSGMYLIQLKTKEKSILLKFLKL